MLSLRHLLFFQKSPNPHSLDVQSVDLRSIRLHSCASSAKHRHIATRSALFVFISTLALLLSGCGASISAKGADALVINPGSISFGNLAVGSSAQAKVTMTNETFKAVDISSVTISGKSFALPNISVPVHILAGASYTLTVTFTPTQAGSATGNLAVASTAAGATTSSSAMIPLSGQATKSTSAAPASAVLTINATAASFGDVALNTTATQSLTLTSTGSTAVDINSATITGAAFTSSGFITPATLPPGQSVTINVQFTPKSLGTATGALVINSNSTGNSTLSLPLNGNGVSEVVQLSWDAPANSGGTIAGYRIYRSVNGAAQYQLLNSSLTAYTEFADSAIQTGQTYDYYVTAVDNSGVESTPSNTATVAVPGT